MTRTLHSVRDPPWHLETGDSGVPFHDKDTYASSSNTVKSSPPIDDSLAHWRRLKGIFANMKSILASLYGAETGSGRILLAAFDKMEAVGDAILMINTFYKSLDPELLQYLHRRVGCVWGDLTEGNPLLGRLTLPNITEARETFVPQMLAKLGHFLHHQAMTFVDELDFILELMKASGFTEEEIYFIFHLLDLPKTSEARQAREDSSQFVSNVGFRRDSHGGYGYVAGGYGQSGGGYGHLGGGYGQSGGGYGHLGGGYGHLGEGYGHSVGYGTASRASGTGYSGSGGYGGYMQYTPKHDPFVVLAGLAFLTLCSYVTYLILSSIHTKRSLAELPMALDLSDVPALVAVVEEAQQVYSPSDQGSTGVSKALSLAYNDLWKSYRKEPESGACVRQYLCQKLFLPGLPHLQPPDEAFWSLNVLSLAQVLGVTGAARSADQLYIGRLQGHRGPSATCRRSTPQCNDLGSDTSATMPVMSITDEDTASDGQRFKVTAEPK
ncbi:uncharacterized protein [Panulirus ornatus]|uniref:uncharacterized protein n=1 Tax=Panulirus ornatus TaxID=150431 RepID=UPI003A850588